MILHHAKAFAKETLGQDASGHNWWHVWRVAKLARRLAEAEQADVFICELTAYLHDIADEKLNKSEAAGLQKVKQWLEAEGVLPVISDQIIEIIGTMSFKGGGRPPMKTLEGQIVQDADRLDAIGAIGIARTFAYSGARGQLIYDPEQAQRQKLTPEIYRSGRTTAINHFYEKLLKLKDGLNTDSARQLAERRHRFMRAFLDEFFQEWEASSSEIRRPKRAET